MIRFGDDYGINKAMRRRYSPINLDTLNEFIKLSKDEEKKIQIQSLKIIKDPHMFACSMLINTLALAPSMLCIHVEDPNIINYILPVSMFSAGYYTLYTSMTKYASLERLAEQQKITHLFEERKKQKEVLNKILHEE